MQNDLTRYLLYKGAVFLKTGAGVLKDSAKGNDF
jgi:hypothetical protein